ncbi:MAG: YjbQ family protein [Methanomassiliicoccales archaeon]|nr:YjbQ family protein [Methanomassiliicoccales archaeon]NYT15978.1 YjbQ family protein [Methanomassiliicoccales archaeon]
MKVEFDDITIFTRSRTEVIDITSRVEGAVTQSSVRNGICLVHTLHSTTAIAVNENELNLKEDIVRKIREDFPASAGWAHDRIDDNADSHIASTYIGPTRTFPIRGGRLVKGTWQSIFLLELDGPRNRQVVVEIMGE